MIAFFGSEWKIEFASILNAYLFLIILRISDYLILFFVGRPISGWFSSPLFEVYSYFDGIFYFEYTPYNSISWLTVLSSWASTDVCSNVYYIYKMALAVLRINNVVNLDEVKLLMAKLHLSL